MMPDPQPNPDEQTRLLLKAIAYLSALIAGVGLARWLLS